MASLSDHGEEEEMLEDAGNPPPPPVNVDANMQALLDYMKSSQENFLNALKSQSKSSKRRIPIAAPERFTGEDLTKVPAWVAEIKNFIAARDDEFKNDTE
ncbi:hypothetical protein HWV62_44267, partial [Athelia sp. TMB]